MRINFDDIWQKYSKESRIQFACFSFYVGLLFDQFSSFKLDTEKTRILTLFQANTATLTPFSKEVKLWIRNLYECKDYNARQFITRVSSWMKNSINRLLIKLRKFGTFDMLTGSVTHNFRHFR